MLLSVLKQGFISKIMEIVKIRNENEGGIVRISIKLRSHEKENCINRERDDRLQILREIC